MPGRVPVFVHLRGWIGALVLAAERVSGSAAGEVHRRDAAPGVFDAQGMRAAVHGELRTAGGDTGQLARAADFAAGSGAGREERTGTNSEMRQRKKPGRRPSM